MLMEVKLCFLLLYKNNFKRYVYVVVIGTKWKDDGKSWFQEVW
jgi:hypothetical protein